jgi:hypothetical protein
MNSLGKAALFPFPPLLPPPVILVGLLLLATAASAALVKSTRLSYSGLESGTKAEAVLGLLFEVFEGPGDVSLPDRDRVRLAVFPGEVGKDVRRGRGLVGGIILAVLVNRRADVESAVEEGGVTDRSSEEVEEFARETRERRLLPSRSVSEPERTCSRSLRWCVWSWFWPLERECERGYCGCGCEICTDCECEWDCIRE